jgi:hypothetical protein
MSTSPQSDAMCAEPRRTTAAATLVVLMAAGSILMWIGVPLGLLWLASRLQDGSQPSMGPYLLILVGLPASMVVIGKVLATLDRAFSRVTGWDPNDRPLHTSWHESLSGERGSQRRRTVLDVVMIVSVVVAGSAFVVWFFLFAHPGMPQA